MLYCNESETVSLWYNDQDHINNEKLNQHGINQITKQEIEKLFNNKVTFPTRILSSLRNMSEKLIPNTNYEYKEVPFVYNPNNRNTTLIIEGLLVPEKLQIKKL